MSTAEAHPGELLTPRQLEVLELLAKGLTNAEIAGVLDIAVGTAKNHVAAVLEALDVTNRTEAAVILSELAGRGADEGASPVPGFGQRPALALLPLDNLGPPEDEAIADGLVEDLTTALAAWRWFPVIARNSTFAYKGRPTDVRQVSRELGARYVLEGSARRAGDRLRVHVQLIDGATGVHHFAERYDRRIDDLFAVQDEIVADIVGSLEPALAQIERLRALRKRSEELDAWEWLQRGLHRLWQLGIGDPLEAERLLRRAVEAAPEAAAGWAALSQCQTLWAVSGDCADPFAWLAEAERSGRRAVELDPMDFAGYLGLGESLAVQRKADAARAALERAVDLNPSCAQAWFALGALSLQPGRQHESVSSCERALRLSPKDPMRHHFLGVLAGAQLWLGRLDEALASARASVAAEPSLAFSYRPMIAAILGWLGRLDEARAARDEVLAISPDFDLAPSRFLAHPELVERVAEGYRRFGWEPG